MVELFIIQVELTQTPNTSTILSCSISTFWVIYFARARSLYSKSLETTEICKREFILYLGIYVILLCLSRSGLKTHAGSSTFPERPNMHVCGEHIILRAHKIYIHPRDRISPSKIV